MKNPIIFLEQLKFASPSLPILENINSYNYKINYNDFLGEGDYGCVYGLVKRPENDKNLFSRSLPYVYDYLAKVDSTTEAETEWCVKVSHSFLIAVRRAIASNTELTLVPLEETITEKKEQIKKNALLQKYQMTDILFPYSDEYYAQIQTRVKGHTVRYCIDNNYFLSPNHFQFRKAFVSFLWKLYNVPLEFDDLQPSNLMYNELEQVIEIVDCSARESKNKNRKCRSFIALLDNYYSKKPLGRLLSALDYAAKNNLHYNEEFDKDLLVMSTLKQTQFAHEFHSTNNAAYDVSKEDASWLIYGWKHNLYSNHFFKPLKEEVTKATLSHTKALIGMNKLP